MMNIVLMPLELLLMVVFVALNFFRGARDSDENVPAGADAARAGLRALKQQS